MTSATKAYDTRRVAGRFAVLIAIYFLVVLLPAPPAVTAAAAVDRAFLGHGRRTDPVSNSGWRPGASGGDACADHWRIDSFRCSWRVRRFDGLAVMAAFFISRLAQHRTGAADCPGVREDVWEEFGGRLLFVGVVGHAAGVDHPVERGAVGRGDAANHAFNRRVVWIDAGAVAPAVRRVSDGGGVSETRSWARQCFIRARRATPGSADGGELRYP